METKKVLESDLSYAIEKALDGEVIAFPTETVYGLGVRYDKKEAFEKLVRVKKRPENKPFTVMCSSIKQIEEIAICTENVRKILNKFTPGPLTLLLPSKSLPDYVTMGTSIVGVRIPDHPIALQLLKRIGPMLVPSANRSGEDPKKEFLDVYREFNGDISAIVYGNCAENSVPSTILDCSTDEIKIVRQGAIHIEDIQEVL